MPCFFCQKNQKEIDCKDTQNLNRFVSLSGKIKARKKSGLCNQHQKNLAQAIKRARFLGLLPYVRE